MRKFLPFGAAIAVLLAMPAALGTAAAQPSDQRAGWRDVATDADRGRIRSWRRQLDRRPAPPPALATPTTSLAKARCSIPTRPCSTAAPPAGDYRCRTIKLGGQGSGLARLGRLSRIPLPHRPATAAAALRQARRVAAAGRAHLPGRPAADDLPRQPPARRRAPRAALRQRCRARHGRHRRAGRRAALAAGLSPPGFRIHRRRDRAGPGA